MKQTFQRLSLKQKWAAVSALVIFISYALMCTVVYISLNTWLGHQEEREAKRTMDDLLALIDEQGARLTIQDFQENSGLMNSIVDRNQTAYILNTQGTTVVQINNAAPVYNDYDTRFITTDEAYILNQPMQLGPFLGVLQVIHPLDAFQNLMRYILIAMIIAGFAALLLSAVIGYQLANYLMKPIEALSTEMTKVKDNGFTERAHLPYSANDELGNLLNVYDAMMAQLEDSFTQQQRFVSDASHELRTPLQAVEGHLALVQRWGKHDEQVLEESIETSLKETRRMKKMIDELLQLARRQQFDKHGHANVFQTVMSIEASLQALYAEARIINECDDNVQVNVPESTLHHILKNIIENGIKYSGEQPTIYIRTTITETTCKIEIEDNGSGIAEEHLPHIFERFYRIDEARSREVEGTGLGLAIVKMMVEKHNGNIFVKSILGVGTVFIVEFDLFKVVNPLN